MLSRQGQFQHVTRNAQVRNLSLPQKHFVKTTQGFSVATKALALLSLGQAF